MTAQHQPYITVESVIQDYLLESESPNHKYFKLFHLAFRGFEQLGLDAFYRIQAAKLPVAENFTVKLPADYMNWTKVGVLNNRGEIIPLYYNDTLTTYADLLPDRSAKVDDPYSTAVSEWGPGVWYNVWNGGSFVNIYGVPSGSPFVGNFKIDLDNGVIILNQDFHYPYIMLEYVCSPKPGGDYYIPVQFREALMAWLWWKDKRAVNVSRGMVGISRDLRSDFYNERRMAISRWKPIRIYDGYQASQEQTRMAVKS